MMTEEYFIRCEDRRIGEGYTDECGEYVPTGSRVDLQFRAYPVIKHTPCGVVIQASRYGGETKFINFSWNKQFAHATKEAALKSFIARKNRQEQINLARARHAAAARQLAEHQLASLEGHSVPLSLADVMEMNA
jgi:hypothetical protein